MTLASRGGKSLQRAFSAGQNLPCVLVPSYQPGLPPEAGVTVIRMTAAILLGMIIAAIYDCSGIVFDISSFRTFSGAHTATQPGSQPAPMQPAGPVFLLAQDAALDQF